MNATARWSGSLTVTLLTLAGCPSPAPSPPAGPAPVVLEVLRRTASGRVDGVAGIPVHRNDPVTGAFVETRTTDAVGRADFGAIQGPVTLSVVRPAPAAGGTTRAYTLLRFPGGTAKLRLDRLPDEPGVPLATVDVPLAPALKSTEGASAALPSGWQGNAQPWAADIPGVVITDQDLQGDGKVTLLTQVDDWEMSTAVGCRLSADQPVTAATNTLAAGVVSLPTVVATSGAFLLERVVAMRKGVAFSLPHATTCAGAFTDADGFSTQGSLGLAGGDVPAPDFYVERQDSERRAALWYPGPTYPASGTVTFPSPDVSIEALAYGAGNIHATLKGTAVRSLVAAHARVSWPSSATEARVWHLYGGLAVTPASCDGSTTDPACTIDQKLPALSGMGSPPDQADGMRIEVEAVAPTGFATAADFWDRLAAVGDAEAVLARGYTGAFRSLALRKLTYLVDVSPYVLPGWYPQGKVVGSGGIDCSLLSQGACSATFPGGTSISLTAIPNAGAEFAGWLGCPGAGTNPSISFTLDRDTYCTPQFRSIGGLSAQLNVAVISTGNGWITSRDGWISCGYDTFQVPHPDCTFNYPSGTMVILDATPSDALNPYKATWGGDCAGTGGTTSVVMDTARNCTVDFTPP